MRTFQTHQFSHEGESYEVRVFSDDVRVYIRTFMGDEPIGEFGYGATWEIVHDVMKSLNRNLLKEFVQLAEQDVRST